ncbi:MAG: hypothetical protein PHT50_01505 [Candidatus Omnitrophica bacterium]|nr:hypothetical protein [Candidatus Omnitrophota bacterium]
MDKKIKPLGTILLLFLSAAVLFFPVFIKWKGVFHNDQAMSEWIRHYFFAQNLQKGVFPLWDPHVWCGALPHYAFIFSGENYYFLLWPFLYLADLANLDNAYLAICLLPLFLHYFIAITGMFLLLKRIAKCNWIASFSGAFVYMYSPLFAYAYVSQDNLIMQSWLPWLIYVYAKCVERFTFGKLFLGALIFAFIWFGGKLQYIPFVIFIWLGFVFFSAAENHGLRNKFNLAKPIGIAALMFALGTVLSAIYLLPVMQGLKFTNLHLDLNLANAVSHKPGNMSPAYLITLLLPNFFGNITGVNFIFERLMFWDANMSGGMAITFMVFVAAIVLIMFSSILAQNKPQRNLIVLGLSLYLFSVLCVLGGNAPFYRLFIGWMPVVRLLPYPIRYRMIQCFAASLLVGCGLNFLTSCVSAELKRKLSKLSLVYVLISILAITGVLFLYGHKEGRNTWSAGFDTKADGFFSLHEPVGVYTPKTARVKKIRVIFDGASQGEIRFADNHNLLPTGGVLIKKYAVLEKGWSEFKVDISPDKFLWILPVSGEGRIGYWNDQDHCFLYSNAWRINQCSSAININKESYELKPALFFRLINGYVEKRPVVFSLLYWLIVSVFIILGIRILSIKKFGYLMAILVILESFFFGTKAFYGGTFNEAQTNSRAFLPHNVRFIRPSEHAMFKQMISEVFPVIDHSMRIASEYPFYDNLVYLNQGFALMGEPPFPLEKRFKEAMEAAYARPMDQSIFYEGGGNLPLNTEFLNNFSVKYFLARHSGRIFRQEECFPINGESAKYLHINKEAIPRVYTINNIVFVDEKEEFRKLVSGDLREALYMSRNYKDLARKAHIASSPFNFEDFQNNNIIKRLDFSNPNEIKIEVEINIPSMMVLTEVWFPGWEAFDGKKRIEIYRVNYCQRGIWLENGKHQIRLRFRPPIWNIGMAISLSTAFFMIVFFIIRLKKYVR